MTQTLRVYFPAVAPAPLLDGIAGIMNVEETDPRRVFEVTRIAINPVGGSVNQGSGILGATTWRLSRISAVLGGDAVAAVKHDTASADLPAQVSCVAFPQSLTETDVLRRVGDAPSLNAISSTANQWLTARLYGALGPYYMADMIRFGGDASVERVVLREGQGIALVMSAEGHSHATMANVTVRNAATGATYRFGFSDSGTPRGQDLAAFAIINGAGSGVVLEVKAAALAADAEQAAAPQSRITRIAGIKGGTAVTPLRHDTAAAVPAALVCRAGAFKAILNGDGAQIDWDSAPGASFTVAQQQNVGVLRRLSQHPRAFAGLAQAAVGLGHGGLDDGVVFSARAGTGIVLNPGEGLALLMGRAGSFDCSVFSYADVEIDVLHYPPPAGGGGGGIRIAGGGGLAA